MTEQTPVPESAEEGNLFQVMMEGMAHMDILHHLDGWFGHWWNRPFWKAEQPLRVLLENITWQGYKRFAISRRGEYSGWDVERFLRDHGIYLWGRGFDSENIYFNVKKEQASYAEYMMLRHGVALTSAPVDPRNAAWAAKYDSAPPGWGTNKRSFLDFLSPFIGQPSGSRTRSFGTLGVVRRSGRRQAARTGSRSRRRQTQAKKQTKKQAPSLRIASAPPGRFRIPGRRPARPRRVGGQSHRK